MKVTHVSPHGKRSFDPDGKRRLVDACLQPGASLSGLALKAGVNANQLRKWVEMYRKASVVAEPRQTIEAEPSAFVPVVTIASAEPLELQFRDVTRAQVEPEARRAAQQMIAAGTPKPQFVDFFI
ncbi:IS66-like element accessory protein TnpA [Burkholderia thailandensis]|uniref:IS66-like element accessory protein TnpA n=1 Tax=Burkholderia thailandensis TaxID=57975 RepID=UPI002D780CDC|nr:transposase [Burkholderia thailandensis]WRS69869.1 transposase [Burkholderia thailandensis]